MARRSKGKSIHTGINLADQNVPVVNEAIQLLFANPKNKKEIANALKLELGQVHQIYQIHFRDGSKKGGIVKPLTTTPSVEETKVEEQKVEEVIAPTPESNEQKIIVVGKSSAKEEKMLALCADVEAGMRVREAAARYEVPEGTAYGWLHQMGISLPGRTAESKKEAAMARAKTRAEKKKAQEPTIEPDTQEISKVSEFVEEKKSGFPFKKVSSSEATIRAMLINERHDFPCTKYIFESVENDRLFDFDWFEKSATAWINTNIPKVNDVWLKGIECYVTGLPAASIALCKVCENLKVNLTFLHYNRDNINYERQVVFSDYPVVNKNTADVLGTYLTNDMDVYVHENTTAEELVKMSVFYIITRRIHDEKASEEAGWPKTQFADRYFFKDQLDGYACLPNIIDANNRSNTPAIISLHEVYREGDKWVIKDPILKSQNQAMTDIMKKHNGK